MSPLRRSLWMLTSGLVILGASRAIRAQDEKKDPKAEYPDRVAFLRKKLAKSHYDIGAYCFDKKCFEFACRQFERALALDPENEFARKKMGFKKEAGKWVRDPKAKVSRSNEGVEYEVLDQVTAAFQKKLADLGKRACNDLIGLAAWCEQGQLAAEARIHYGESIDYDLNSAKARKALGFAKKGDLWVLPAEKEVADRVAESLKNASEGEEVTEISAVERAIGVKLNKRRSTHFLIQAPFTPDQLKEHVRLAEAALWQLAFVFENPLFTLSKPAEMVFLGSQEDHERYILVYWEGTREQKEWAKKNYGGCNDAGRFERRASTDRADDLDFTVHMVSHLGVGGEKPWLSEGAAYYFSSLMLGTARMRCVGSERVAGGKGFGGVDTMRWKHDLRISVAEGADPDLESVLGADSTSISQEQVVKGWSVIDFLLSERELRSKFKLFLQRISAGLPQTQAMEETFGWSLARLDEEWRSYVRMKY